MHGCVVFQQPNIPIAFDRFHAHVCGDLRMWVWQVSIVMGFVGVRPGRCWERGWVDEGFPLTMHFIVRGPDGFGASVAVGRYIYIYIFRCFVEKHVVIDVFG